MGSGQPLTTWAQTSRGDVRAGRWISPATIAASVAEAAVARRSAWVTAASTDAATGTAAGVRPRTAPTATARASAPLPYDAVAARYHGVPARRRRTAAVIASPRVRSVPSSRDSCSATTSAARQPWSSHASAASTNVCASMPTLPLGAALPAARPNTTPAVRSAITAPSHGTTAGTGARATSPRAASDAIAAAPTARSISRYASMSASFSDRFRSIRLFVELTISAT